MRISPVKIDNPTPIVHREYRQLGAYQWVREAIVNALEAGATRIHFGVDWQVVKRHEIYRRTIIDNGCGMTADELVDYFTTLGHGSKPIGGAHENYGIGARISLLPWNPKGVVIISARNGDTNLVHIVFDEEKDRYGLRNVHVNMDGHLDLLEVLPPFQDDDYRADWTTILPEWARDHGTAIVLLGNGGDSMHGDQTKGESQRGVISYVSDRFYDLPAAVTIEEFDGERPNWPIIPRRFHDDGIRPAWTTRNVKPQHQLILERAREAEGSLDLADGTTVTWALAQQPWAKHKPFVGVFYDGELYDVSRTAPRYRQFGVVPTAVRERLYIILKPIKMSAEGDGGAFPTTGRTTLKVSTPQGARDLPWEAWADEWNRRLPDEIARAIDATQSDRETIDLTDPRYRKLLREFARRMAMPVRRVDAAGETTVQLDRTVVTLPRARRKLPEPVERQDKEPRQQAGVEPDSEPARESTTQGGIPKVRWVSAEDLGEPGMMAVWSPHGGDGRGEVLLSRDHPVFLDMVQYHQSEYPTSAGDSIRVVVRDVFGAQAALKVAHVLAMGSIVGPDAQRQMLSSAALTTGLLGLQGEDTLIRSKLRGTLLGMHKVAKAS